MTRDEIVAHIGEDLNSAAYYTSEDLNDSMQDAYDEIAAFTGCITKSAPVPFEANTVYYDFLELIPEFVTVLGIWNGRTKKWMIPVSYREMDNYRSDWELSRGEPFAFCPVNYRYIAIFPSPSDSNNYMHVFYRAQAEEMTGSSEPSVPDDIVEEIFGAYVMTDMHEQQMEWVKAKRRWKTYQQKITDLLQWLAGRDSERFKRLGGSF